MHVEHPVRLDDGAEGRAVGYTPSNLMLDLVVPAPYAPGRPVVLELLLGEARFGLSGKALGSRARGDGTFSLTLRLTNLRREARLALEQAFSALAR